MPEEAYKETNDICINALVRNEGEQKHIESPSTHRPQTKRLAQATIPDDGESAPKADRPPSQRAVSPFPSHHFTQEVFSVVRLQERLWLLVGVLPQGKRQDQAGQDSRPSSIDWQDMGWLHTGSMFGPLSFPFETLLVPRRAGWVTQTVCICRCGWVLPPLGSILWGASNGSCCSEMGFLGFKGSSTVLSPRWTWGLWSGFEAPPSSGV